MVRRVVQAKLLLLLLGAVIAAIGVSGCGDWVARVNGRAIDEDTFNRRLAEMQIRYAGQTPSQEDEEGFDSFRGTVAEDLVMRELLKEEAERMDISFTDEQVDQGLQEVKNNNYGGDDQKFQEALEREGISEERAREQLAEGMLLTELKLRVTAEAPGPTEDEIKVGYERNPKKYEIAPQIKLRHVQVASEDEAKGVLDRLAQGEDMAALAQSLSTDPGSKDQGGDLGWVINGSIEDESLSNAVFSLSPGVNSEPIKSSFGWHIARVEETKPAYQRSFEESKETIKNELLEQSRDSYWSGWLLELKQGARIEYRDGYKPPGVEQ